MLAMDVGPASTLMASIVCSQIQFMNRPLPDMEENPYTMFWEGAVQYVFYSWFYYHFPVSWYMSRNSKPFSNLLCSKTTVGESGLVLTQWNPFPQSIGHWGKQATIQKGTSPRHHYPGHQRRARNQL